MIDVGDAIAVALESRRAHQGRIDEFHESWNALARSVDGLAETIAGPGGRVIQAEGAEADGSRRAGNWGLSELHELRGAIASLTPDIAAVHARFHRSTVNIGVVGQVAAGKSMLLRTTTGLGEVVIPSGGLKPTTAARSRILHSPGRADAKVLLRTWEGFRDGYLQPLHDDAGLGPAPPTPGEFTGFPYQRALDNARADAGRGGHGPIDKTKYLQRLLVAQLSFPSYQRLLEEPGHKLDIDRLPELRRFVAYPADDGRDRPYHAVHDVWIYCEFQVGGVQNLVLVDLPGAGEAALNIEKQFLADLRNQVDVLLQVKRPVVSRSWIGDEDWKVLKLADEASMGVNPADFIKFVINTDPANVTPEQLNNAVAEATTQITEPSGILLLVGDVSSPSDVQQEILGPVLEHLGHRLAAMDRTAAGTQVAKARDLAGRADAVARRIADEVRRRERLIPSEDVALATMAKRLRNSVSKQLDDLIEEYDRRAREQVPIPELAQAIKQAADDLTRWAEAGFGLGSTQEWIAKVEEDLSAELGETRDDQCTRARRQIREEFGRIDSSLTTAVDRLHAQVAGLLPGPLSAAQAPAGPGAMAAPAGEQPLHALAAAADRLRLESLRAALSTLLDVRSNYGDIFLRVGGPVVDRVSPGPGPLPGEGAAPGPDAAPRGGAGRQAPAFYRGARAVADVVSSVHPAAGAAAQVAAAAPVVLGWIWDTPIGGRSAESLHEALSRAFHDAVRQIRERMLAEAGLLSGVLAAALNQFKDDFIRDPDIEREWKELCRPIRQELWPRAFSGESGALVAEYGRISGAISACDAAVGAVLTAAGTISVPGARH
jgi:hypothetical protein